MHITPPADDYGLQKLKKADSGREVKETGEIDARPRIETDEELHEPKLPVVARHPNEQPRQARAEEDGEPLERRREQRRKGSRRRHEEKTTLNTRDNHERRHQLRREEDREAAEGGTVSDNRGVDDFV